MGDAITKSKGNNRGLHIIIGLLCIAVLVLAYLLSETKTDVVGLEESNIELTTERSELEEGLVEMLQQYDTLSVENDEMKGKVLQQREEIASLLERVQKLKKDDSSLRWEIGKLKKEAGTLRDIMKDYLVTIDSLNQENIALTHENQTLSTNLSDVSSQKNALANKLEDQASIIKAGPVLTANSFIAEAIRVRSTGAQKETNRASRAEMIKSCVNLAQNNISKKGPKTLHVRVISPEGLVLDDKNNIGKTFNFSGVSGKYSAKRQFDYDGTGKSICVFHTVTSELTAGQYIVEIYEAGSLIGKTKFDLR
jgi:regulator of replication initiation timing